MNTRKNYLQLSTPEKTAFVNALLKLKKDGNPATGRNYDTYVTWHVQMMSLPMSQMRAHMSPMFLPWHRQYLRLLELDLQAVSGNPNLTIPFWDWTSSGSEENDPLWADDFMGGNGRSGDKKVMTGPFAFDKGNWAIKNDDSGRSFLTRNIKGDTRVQTLPTRQDVAAALAIGTYDRSPWDMSSNGNLSFRNNLEGWSPNPPRLHNRVHVWVGGSNATMAQSSSPNDPVFFLHHCNVDRIWAHWQSASASHKYLPETEQPTKPGISAEAVMPSFPGNVKVKDVLDIALLGYEYGDQLNIKPKQLKLPVPPKIKKLGPGVVFKPFIGFTQKD